MITSLLSPSLILSLFLVNSVHSQPSIPPWPTSVFYTDISKAPLDTNSDGIIASMKSSSAGGAGKAKGIAWGSYTGDLQIDFSLVSNWVTSTSQYTCVNVTGPAASPSSGPDCEDLSSGNIKFPLPIVGAIEGISGYGACSGDCHLSVYDAPNNLLWESYQTSFINGVLTSTCVIIWDLTQNYPSNLRGDQCTSVDAAGFPVAPLIVTADEVSSGKINHALRLALPNDMLQTGVYAHPATHASNVLKGADPSPFYGMRMRLKSSFVNSDFPNPEKSNMTALGIIFNALKTYGMFMTDGSSQGVGGIPLMLANDTYSTAKWAAMNIDSHSLFSLTVDDFEVVQPLDPTSGAKGDGRITLTFKCVRNFQTPARAYKTCSTTPTPGSSKSNQDTPIIQSKLE